MRSRRFVLARLAPSATGLAAVVAVLAIWQGAAALGWINKFVAPAPVDILRGIPLLLTEEHLLRRVLQTFAETFAAAGLAVLIGVPVGYWLHRRRLAALAFESWVGGLAAAPLVLAYPLFLVLFGRNAVTIVVMSFLTGLPAIVLKTKEGLDSVKRVLVNVGRSCGLAPAQLFRKIMLPAAMPAIATGIRLALIFALINVVGVEFLINFGGLGELIDDLGQRWETAKMFGAIVFVVLVSAAFYWLTAKIERWVRPHG